MWLKPRCPFLCYLDILLLVHTERLTIKGKQQLHWAAQPRAKEISLICPALDSLVLPLHKGAVIWIQKLCPWDLLQIEIPLNQHKNRRKYREYRGTSQGRVYYGVSIPQWVSANRDAGKEKQKFTQRCKKRNCFKKKKRGGEKETPIHFRRKASMLELVRKWLAFASQKNLWVSLTFWKISNQFCLRKYKRKRKQVKERISKGYLQKSKKLYRQSALGYSQHQKSCTLKVN